MDSRVQHNHQLRAALNSSPWWCLWCRFILAYTLL
jgi:hypothetical protein